MPDAGAREYSRRGWNRLLRRLSLSMKAATMPSAYELSILTALQDKPMYQGTASANAVAARRSLGKRQKASRRANRA